MSFSSALRALVRDATLLIAAAAFSGGVYAQQARTATLQQLTANNTSASAAAGNRAQRAAEADDVANATGAVSKVPIRELLGTRHTLVYAHLMPWFGSSGHITVGYDSASAEQIRRQVEDMISRGIDGAVVYWTGPPANAKSAHTHDVVLKLMKEAERHPDFHFAVQEDKQALKDCASHGCDLSGELSRHLQFMARTFFTSSAYWRMNERPLVFFFGLEEYKIDWNRVRASIQGNPLFVFRNSGGFTYAQSDGAFAWTAINKSDPGDIGLAYLERFYRVAAEHPQAVSIGSVYAGFNDQLASWRQNRVINRNCGKTWLRTFEEARPHLSGLSAVQIVTWNDYEEGSQIEPGIDNCVTVQASASADALQWTINGNERTVHHFAVWGSTGDGRFRLLAELPPSSRRIGYRQAGLGSGNYVFVVQAVGQPSMLNQLSERVSAVVAGH